MTDSFDGDNMLLHSDNIRLRFEIERLRAALEVIHSTSRVSDYVHGIADKALSDESPSETLLRKALDEIERLRAALQKIVDEADSDDGMTAWDGGDIARAALSPKDRKDDWHR